MGEVRTELQFDGSSVQRTNSDRNANPAGPGAKAWISDIFNYFRLFLRARDAGRSGHCVEGLQ
jgi:hypothetical protein